MSKNFSLNDNLQIEPSSLKKQASLPQLVAQGLGDLNFRDQIPPGAI